MRDEVCSRYLYQATCYVADEPRRFLRQSQPWLQRLGSPTWLASGHSHRRQASGFVSVDSYHESWLVAELETPQLDHGVVIGVGSPSGRFLRSLRFM